MATKPKRIGEELLAAGLINQNQLMKALERQRNWGGRLGSNLVLIGAIKEHDLMRFMALKTGVREMNVTDVEILPEVIRKVPQKVVEKFHVLPVYVKDKKTLVLALADPTDLEAIDQVSFITGMNVEPVVASYSSILQAIHRYYFGAQLREVQNQEITVQEGYREEDMEAHGGHGALGDPDLIIFGRQEGQPRQAGTAPIQAGGVPPAPREADATPPAPIVEAKPLFDFDMQSETAGFTSPAPLPDTSALDQFSDEQKLLGLMHVLIKKRLVSEAEIAQELTRLWSLGKLK